ncbi:biotin carboxyl carrier protein [Sinorhizobium americanum]|uniref:Biotin carboxyl carrier protein n=1 Tax=Sinorhizobium americanum TaxID=194963 RepID=A0A4R2C198_9HYPH|nr:biotin carboxyl carrier protein [Sinorhizobium americanum]
MNGRKRKGGSIAEEILDPATLKKVALWLDDAGVNSVEIETEDGRLVRIVAGAGVSTDDVASNPDISVARNRAQPVKAPIAGHFLPVHPARDRAEATVGAAVVADEIIGFVKIGPLVMPLRVEEAGRLEGCGIEPGALVGYGDTVFLIEPAQ